MIGEVSTWVLIALSGVIAALAIGVVRARAIFAVAMMLAALALAAALALMALDAPELALAQAAIGLGLVAPLCLGVITLTVKTAARGKPRWAVIAAVVALVALMLWAAPDLPPLGGAGMVSNAGAVAVNRGLGESGLHNGVRAMAANYRAFDAIGAAVAVFIAALGVYAALGFGERSALRAPSAAKPRAAEEAA